MTKEGSRLCDLGTLVRELAQAHRLSEGDRDRFASAAAGQAGDWARYFEDAARAGAWTVRLGDDESSRVVIRAPLIADGLFRLYTTDNTKGVGLVSAEWSDVVVADAGVQLPVKQVVEHWLLFDAAATIPFSFPGTDGTSHAYAVSAASAPSRLPWPRQDAPDGSSVDLHYAAVGDGKLIRPDGFLAGVRAAYRSAPFSCRYVQATISVYGSFPAAPAQDEYLPDGFNGRGWEEWVASTASAKAKERSWVYGEFERVPPTGSSYTRAGRLHLAWRGDLPTGLPNPDGGQGFSAVRSLGLRRELDTWFATIPGVLAGTDANPQVLYAQADLKLYSGAELATLLNA